MSQSVGQTGIFGTDSRRSDNVCSRYTANGSLRAEKNLNLKQYRGKSDVRDFREGAGNKAMTDLIGHEAGNGGYWQREPKATVQMLHSTEITLVSVADVVHMTKGSTLIADSSWRGGKSQTVSETVALANHFDQTFLKFDMRTREVSSFPLNGTRLITYPENGGAVLQKSRTMENPKFGSDRSIIAASGRG